MYFVIAHKFIGSASKASGSLMTDIFCFIRLIIVSFLHLGQKSGKFSSTVSGLTFVRGLLPQIGQSTHVTL
jgi:hypothetical protein